MRIWLFQQHTRVIVFLKTPIVYYYHLVAFNQMFELMRHGDNRVGFEVFFDKVSYENVRLCVETMVMESSILLDVYTDEIAYLLVISSIIMIELGCARALARTKSWLCPAESDCSFAGASSPPCRSRNSHNPTFSRNDMHSISDRVPLGSTFSRTSPGIRTAFCGRVSIFSRRVSGDIHFRSRPSTVMCPREVCRILESADSMELLPLFHIVSQ